MDNEQGMNISLMTNESNELILLLAICRVCRSEPSLTQPLFHPCKCSGSIRFVHQEW